MNPVEWARTLAAYNRWMNERLYALCAELPDAERKRDRGAFFRSIHGTLNHLLLGDRIWLARFRGEPYAVQSLDQELYADFEELRSERERTDREITRFVTELAPAAFEGTLHYTSIVNPAPRSLPFWLALTHFFNHQAHHRGQLTTLLVQAGVDPGVTDLIWLPELMHRSRLMTEIRGERLTAEVDAEFVVFLIGMRFNRLWKVWRWGPVALAMARMIRELEADPGAGFLGVEAWAGTHHDDGAVLALLRSTRGLRHQSGARAPPGVGCLQPRDRLERRRRHLARDLPRAAGRLRVRLQQHAALRAREGDARRARDGPARVCAGAHGRRPQPVTGEALALVLAVLVVALLYSSVGHAGASGYIAVMSLAGLSAAEIPIRRLLALVLALAGAKLALGAR